MNNEQSLFYVLADISAAVREMNKAIYQESKEIRSKEMYDKAMLLYGAVGQFLDELEDRDENMNPETMKLPDMDEVFEGNPVSEYVNAMYNMVSGGGKMEQVVEAAKKLRDFQDEKYAEVAGEPEPEVKKELTLEDFINHIVEDQKLANDDYATSFKAELAQAIKVLKNRPGYCTFMINTKDRGTLAGNLNATGDNVKINIDDTRYDFVEYRGAKNVEEEEYGGFCSEYPEVEALDDEPYTGYGCEDDCCEAEPEEDPSLLEQIMGLDEIHAEEVNQALDIIQEHLDSVSEFSEEDIVLIRYFLSHLPINNPDEIADLSDKAVKLAYRQRQLVRVIK